MLRRSTLVLFSVALATVIGLSAGPSQAAEEPITGFVFRDHDQDGTRDEREFGLAGITVIAADVDGVEISRTETEGDGTYTLTGTDDGSAYQVSFEWATPYLEPSAVGPDSGSTVQFARGGDTVNFALANPADFCALNEGDVAFATSCFVNGDPLQGLHADEPTIVSTLRASGVAGRDGIPDATKLAFAGQIGSTYGLAFQPSSQRLMAGAFLKRHVGLGEGGIDAIYSIDIETGDVGLWYAGIDAGTVPSNAERGLPDDPTDAPTSLDADAFAQIMKVGWGDLDFNENGEILYAANLFDRNIYAIDVAAVDAGSTEAHTSIGRPTLDCPNGVDRPFALNIQDGTVVVGVTCTAENGGTRADLSAHVFTYDPVAAQWSDQAILNVPLDYDDGCLLRDMGCEMHPWLDEFTYDGFFFQANAGTPFEFPLRSQPMLADIVFDTDASLIIGIRDRQSDQFGHRNLTPIDDDNLVTSAANGDVLRASPPIEPGGTFILESNGTVGGRRSSGTGTERFGPGGIDSGQGPGGGEFYWSDYVLDGNGEGFHSENFMGSLAQIAGTSTSAATQVDPRDGRLDAGGIIWLDHDTGANSDSIELYQDAAPSQPSTFGKANGLGDVEPLCAAAPVQIGNRAWFDRDEDGIQDPTEPSIPGVTVMLLDADGNVVETTTTDAGGTYAFYTKANTAYTVMFDPSTADVSQIPEVAQASHLSATVATQGDNDEVDSNPDPLTLKATVVTGRAGAHDHSIDAGFIPSPYQIGNLVWLDNDNDGMSEAGEPGIANVTVQLWRDEDLDGVKETLVDEQVTDAEGHYLFTFLPIGSYGVLIPDQSAEGEPLHNMVSSTPTSAEANNDVDNDDNGIDPGPNDSPALMSGLVELIGGEPLGETLRKDDPTPDSASDAIDPVSNLTVDFGFFQTSAIGQYIWIDADRNGQRDSGEEPVPGVTVHLCDASGTILDTLVSDENGSFIFDELDPGSYKICIEMDTLPEGYTFTSPNVGDDGSDSDVDPANGMSTIVEVSGGQFTLDLFVGIVPPTAALEGVVWLDTNRDGIQDPNESGVSGVTVHLCDADMERIATTLTDADGTYLFPDVDPGTYCVCFDMDTLRDGAVATLADVGDDTADSDADPSTGKTPAVTLTAGVTTQNIDLGIVEPIVLPPALPVTGSDLFLYFVAAGLLIAGLGSAFVSAQQREKPATVRAD